MTAAERRPLVIPDRPTEVTYIGLHREEWFDSDVDVGAQAHAVLRPDADVDRDLVAVHFRGHRDRGRRDTLSPAEARRYGETLIALAALAESQQAAFAATA